MSASVRRDPIARQKLIARAKALTAAQSTPALVASLRALAPQIEAARATADRTRAIADYDQCAALNTTHAWIAEALENRYPQAVKALETAFEANEDADYDAVLITAIPESERV